VRQGKTEDEEEEESGPAMCSSTFPALLSRERLRYSGVPTASSSYGRAGLSWKFRNAVCSLIS
jgi:hypothetical protein